jgi:hypothetical protein
MSKADAQRAFREANYAKRAAAAATAPSNKPPKPPKAPPEAAPETRGVKAVQGVSQSDAIEGALCGHRSMNNRTCRRPAGHSEKSHRYQ